MSVACFHKTLSAEIYLFCMIKTIASRIRHCIAGLLFIALCRLCKVRISLQWQEFRKTQTEILSHATKKNQIRSFNASKHRYSFACERAPLVCCECLFLFVFALTHADLCMCMFVFVYDCCFHIAESSPRRERKLKLEETSRSCVRSSSWRRTWRATWTGSLRLKILTLTTRTRLRRGASETVSNHPLSHKQPTLLNLNYQGKYSAAFFFFVVVGMKALGFTYWVAHFLVTNWTRCATTYMQTKLFKSKMHKKKPELRMLENDCQVV